MGFREDNVYEISPVGWNRPNVNVYCDMRSGGWTVIQRRSDPNVNFYRGWSNYKAGFGDKRGDFWLGNDVIHYVTSQDAYILQVDITSVDNNMSRYDMGPFLIGPESKNYRLEYGLNGSVGNPFSTYDHYGDAWSCVKLHEGAWWYGDMRSHCSTVDEEVACNYANDDVTGCYVTCTNNNLNGKFDTSLFWNGTICNIRKTEMKILPSW
ncbi:techylectin-5B-like [Apostichopus japonicus]|uniref:techylectin-5B-like n=1 Tax=Stichopus japonicus TaxID=307972 RepID=UPI003AB1304D